MVDVLLSSLDLDNTLGCCNEQFNEFCSEDSLLPSVWGEVCLLDRYLVGRVTASQMVLWDAQLWEGGHCVWSGALVGIIQDPPQGCIHLHSHPITHQWLSNGFHLLTADGSHEMEDPCSLPPLKGRKHETISIRFSSNTSYMTVSKCS